MLKKIFLICLTSLINIPEQNVIAQFSGITPEKLWDFGRISDPQISPDGQWVLFGVTKYSIEQNKGKRSLYLASLKNGEVQMIREMVNSAYNARWRPDGKKIGYLSDKGGDMQLWEMDQKGDQQQQVTFFKHPINNFEYSPDMNHISFSMNVKLDKTTRDLFPDLPESNAMIIDDLMYRHWDEWRDYSYSHLCIISYDNGHVTGAIKNLMLDEKYDWPTQPFGGTEDMTWSPDGRSIAYVCKKYTGSGYALNTNSDIYWYDIESGNTQNISEGLAGYDIRPVFSNDGQKIAWLNMARSGYESDQSDIKIFDIKTGSILSLTNEFDKDITGLSWGTDDKIIHFVASADGTYQVFSLNLGTTVFDKIKENETEIRQVTKGLHDIVDIRKAGNNLVATVMNMTEPAEIFSISLTTGELKPVTALNKTVLNSYKSGKVESRFVKTHDGKDMLVWIIFPPDFDAAKKYPAILYCQGGPHDQVSQFFSYRWNFQLMASRGYIVVAPNRRGLPGFGASWNDAISGNWGGDVMKDYFSAIDAVAKEPYVDAEHLGAVGASYGGYSVFYLAGIHEKRFKAFIAHCGVFNLESWYGSTEELFFPNWDLGGPYWKVPRPPSYDLHSPHKLVDKWDTPMLVIHGGKDYRIPYTQAMEAFTALQLNQIPSRLLFFPEENHWVLSPQNGILWQRVFFEWLDKWLKN